MIWGGEFGRTAYCQGTLTADDYGRDHHPRCFSIWMAGGGVKPGLSHGGTDDLRLKHRPKTRSTSTTYTPRCFAFSGSIIRVSVTDIRDATFD